MLVCMSANVTADNNINQLNKYELIAINAPTLFECDYDWSIVKTTPLYNHDNHIIAYCYDMKTYSKTVDNHPLTAYTVVNVTNDCSKVLMCGINGVSPYFDLELDKAYFFGALEYYGTQNGRIYNLRTDETISQSTFSRISSQYMQALEFSANNENLNENQHTYQLNSADEFIDYKVLESVPLLQWQYGCAPTAVAMMIMNPYPYLNPDYLIGTLASYMGTTADGSTSFVNISSGTRSFIEENGFGVPTYCNWTEMQSDGIHPKVGFRYNTKEIYKQSIDMFCPVGVYVSGSSVITASYSNMGAHMMTGKGYSFNHTGPYLFGDYIICHTTQIRDGAVCFPMDDSSLQNVAWFLLQ